MLAPRIRGALFLSLAVVLTACGNSTEPAGNTGNNQPTNSLTAVRDTLGDGQVGVAGSTLPVTILAVKDLVGLAGATVTFAVTQGSATVSPPTATTDVNGMATTNVILGTTPGPVVVTATVSGVVAVFNLGNGVPVGDLTPACQRSAAATIPIGGVSTDLTGTGICLGGGSTGAEYALVAFNGDPISYGNPDDAAATLSVTSSGGATSVFSASAAPALNLTPLMSSARMSKPSLQETFGAHLRDMSRRELTASIPAARQFAQQRANFATIPANPTVGTLVTLNAQGLDACKNTIMVTARVVAVSNGAIVVADTANPSGGFTSSDYAYFAATFDTLISPIDVQNFGAPSDIDKNGKVIIFFTKEVNKLTPRGSNGFIGGFFFERDLFPTADANGLSGCPGSNYAEMYYSLVPDPTGKYSDARSDSSVKALTPGTLVHEFQHLINAGRRIYVNNADSFEETWLNEGLSHIAEELLYYHVSGNAPRQNITASVLGRTQTTADIFNDYQGDNTGRYEVFLSKPNQTSVYADNDSLETRGATWNLLRYLADHRGTADADTWSKLDNTALTGEQNIANVFGTDYMTQIRNWATSVFADDVTGQTDTRFSQPSWDYRNIFPALQDDFGRQLNKYPLLTFPLSDGSPLTTSVDAGGAAYIRFAVPANASVSINWGLANPLMQFTIVRSK